MPIAPPSLPTVFLDLLQIGVAVALAGLFYHYRQIYHRAHLALWSQSFALMAAALLLSRLVEWLHPGWPEIPLVLGSEAAGYLHIGFLALGTLGLLRGPKLSHHLLRQVVVGALLVTAVTTLPWLIKYRHEVADQLAFHSVPRELTTAVAYLGLAAAMLEHGRRYGALLGQKLVGMAFAFYGSFNLAGLGVALFRADAAMVKTLDPVGTAMDLVAVIGIGFGLVIWLLEDEHERAEGATSAVEQLTWFDPLTGLPNRRQLEHRLAALLEKLAHFSRRAALFTLELDRPQRLRESLGSVGSTNLLAEIARRLGEDLGENEILARLEGDRFALVIPDALGATAAWRAARLLRRMREPFSAEGHAVYATLSIGIAMYPTDERNPEALIHSALLALGRVHSEGGDSYRFHADGLEDAARDRLTLAADVRRALDSNEFELHYQPIVDARRLVAISAEALLRWKHPERGLILPDNFLNAVEDAGAMRQLDQWVLRRACAQLAEWRAQGLLDVVVAVNVSAQSFQADNFTDMVRDELDRAEVAPPQIELEITEASAMHDLDRASETLDRLRRLGVAVTLDDFGMGFSSLSRLKHLAVDKLKIDKSFTMGVTAGGRDAAIVAAIVALAHSLGLRVVAEGVETWEQAAFYRTQGVLGLQGYRFHHALTAAEVAPLLARQGDVVASRGG